MRFRPCIDIHNGSVKQIVGGSLRDQGDTATTNYTSEFGAEHFAEMYRRDSLSGGHVIMLNPASSEYYPKTKAQALRALEAYPGGLQIGGGITAENAAEYLLAGASHVIVTSYVFQKGEFQKENMERLVRAAGKEHIVLDLSCRKRGDDYYIVTDRWQTFTDWKLTEAVIDELGQYCDEYLIHGVDAEGKQKGIAEDLVRILAKSDGHTITYAGGIGSLADLEHLQEISGGKLDFTIGSALDLFGGAIPYREIAERYNSRQL